MRRFVMGDIHGADRALIQCLERSNFNYETDHLIQLGDIIDGHNGAYGCVEELLKIKNLVSIIGNHDAWFIEFLKTGRHPKSWGNGGEATILSYNKSRIKEADYQNSKDLKPHDIPTTHRELFYNQKLYHITEDNCLFVHAGFKPNLTLQQQGYHLYDDRQFWDEIQKYKNSGIPDKFSVMKPYQNIYIGHSPTTKSGTDQPIQILNLINLDTGAAKGNNGRLTIMDLDTKAYWQSDHVDLLCGN